MYCWVYIFWILGYPLGVGLSQPLMLAKMSLYFIVLLYLSLHSARIIWSPVWSVKWHIIRQVAAWWLMELFSKVGSQTRSATWPATSGRWRTPSCSIRCPAGSIRKIRWTGSRCSSCSIRRQRTLKPGWRTASRGWSSPRGFWKRFNSHQWHLQLNVFLLTFVLIAT